MKTKNGIIIDGVLHEQTKSKSKGCGKCSLYELCHKEFGTSALCWIALGSEQTLENMEFKCIGKINDIQIENP